MRASDALQLEPVFEQPHEFVCADQILPVLAADVACLDEGAERVDGGGDPQCLVGPAVHHLEQLDGEFDVTESAAPEFEFAVAEVLRDIVDHPAAHRLDIVDEALPPAGVPHHRVQRIEIGVPESPVAGHGAGLEQRLELPGVGPPFVVRDVGFEGAHKGTVLALRPEGRVNLEEGAAADADELAGETGRPAVGRFGDEDDVDVGDVVQLAGAALAHRHDGDAGVEGFVAVDPADGDGQRGGQCGVGEVGEQACDHREWDLGLSDAAW